MKWIEIITVGRSASGKTLVFSVRPKDGGNPIGEIAWYGPWRKYAFYPEPNTVFESDCLRDLAQFCAGATSDHRTKDRPCSTPSTR